MTDTVNARVLALALAGLSIEQIATAMSLSLRTVETILQDTDAQSTRVLALAAAGLSVQQIAKAMSMSLKAVEAVIQNLDTPLPSPGGSGGLVLGAQNDRAFASFSAIPCDGSPHNLTLAGIGSPPAWLDVDGNITEAGLYTFVIGVSRNVAPTTSGLAVYFSTPCNGSKYAALDILRGGDETLTETEPVTDADLPFFAGTSVVTPTDDTATFDAFYVIVRAAH